MKVAALYDIHGNLPALEAVIPQLEADVVVVGGDVASGPFPLETLELLRSLPVPVRFVRGNADRVLDLDEILEAHRSARLWVAERLGEANVRFLRELPLDVVVEGVRFCHGAPGSDTEPITRVTSDERLRRLLRDVDESVVVCGHTHVQFDRLVDAVRVLNAGSVGFPYEAEPGAYWVELTPEPVFHRTEYDVEEAIARIRATGHPNADWAEELALLDPGRPQRMSEIIEGWAT
ncbi:MAG: metallophosphoesterase family protein [Actinobacteria bacterium]|nr:metallophosphoesterase family protein [Actinomycetota bacterium]